MARRIGTLSFSGSSDFGGDDSISIDDLRNRAAAIALADPQKVEEARAAVQPSGNFLTNILGVLDVPRKVVTSAIDALVPGDQSAMVEEGFGTLIKDLPLPHVLKQVAGFAGDVLTDPLSFVGGPGFRGAKAVQQATFSHIAREVGGDAFKELAEKAGREAGELATAQGLSKRRVAAQIERGKEAAARAAAASGEFPDITKAGEAIFGTMGKPNTLAKGLAGLPDDMLDLLKGTELEPGMRFFVPGGRLMGLNRTSFPLVPQSVARGITRKVSAPLSKLAKQNKAINLARSLTTGGRAYMAGFAGHVANSAVRAHKEWSQQSLDSAKKVLIDKVAPVFPTNDETLQAALRAGLSSQEGYAALEPAQREAVDTVREILDATHKEFVNTFGAEALPYTEFFFPRVLGSGGERVLRDEGGILKGIKTTPTTAKDVSIRKGFGEAEKQAREYYKLKEGEQFFEHNPYVAVEKYVRETTNAIAVKRITDEMQKAGLFEANTLATRFGFRDKWIKEAGFTNYQEARRSLQQYIRSNEQLESAIASHTRAISGTRQGDIIILPNGEQMSATHWTLGQFPADQLLFNSVFLGNQSVKHWNSTLGPHVVDTVDSQHEVLSLLLGKSKTHSKELRALRGWLKGHSKVFHSEKELSDWTLRSFIEEWESLTPDAREAIIKQSGGTHSDYMTFHATVWDNIRLQRERLLSSVTEANDFMDGLEAHKAGILSLFAKRKAARDGIDVLVYKNDLEHGWAGIPLHPEAFEQFKNPSIKGKSEVTTEVVYKDGQRAVHTGDVAEKFRADPDVQSVRVKDRPAVDRTRALQEVAETTAPKTLGEHDALSPRIKSSPHRVNRIREALRHVGLDFSSKRVKSLTVPEVEDILERKLTFQVVNDIEDEELRKLVRAAHATLSRFAEEGDHRILRGVGGKEVTEVLPGSALTRDLVLPRRPTPMRPSQGLQSYVDIPVPSEAEEIFARMKNTIAQDRFFAGPDIALAHDAAGGAAGMMTPEYAVGVSVAFRAATDKALNERGVGDSLILRVPSREMDVTTVGHGFFAEDDFTRTFDRRAQRHDQEVGAPRGERTIPVEVPRDAVLFDFGVLGREDMGMLIDYRKIRQLPDEELMGRFRPEVPEAPALVAMDPRLGKLPPEAWDILHGEAQVMNTKLGREMVYAWQKIGRRSATVAQRERLAKETAQALQKAENNLFRNQAILANFREELGNVSGSLDTNRARLAELKALPDDPDRLMHEFFVDTPAKALKERDKELARVRRLVTSEEKKLAALERRIASKEKAVKSQSETLEKRQAAMDKRDRKLTRAEAKLDEAQVEKDFLDSGLKRDGKEWPGPKFDSPEVEIQLREKGWRPIKNTVSGELNGNWAPAPIADEMERAFTRQNKHHLVRSYDKFLGHFRKWVTIPFPGFHLRNLIGGFTNNFMGGVSVRDYLLANRIWGFSSKSKKFADEQHLGKWGIDATAGEVRAMAEAQGIGASSGGMFLDFETVAGGGRFERNPYLAKMSRVARGTEDVLRTSAFVNGLATLKDPTAARAFVMVRQGDYSELTPEEEWIRRFIPFYKWSRMNIPLQMNQLFTRPGQLVKVEKFKDQVIGDPEAKERFEGKGGLLQKSLVDRGAFFANVPGLGDVAATLDLPTQDLTKISVSPVELLKNALGESIAGGLVEAALGARVRGDGPVNDYRPVSGPMSLLARAFENIPGLQKLTLRSESGELWLNNRALALLNIVPQNRLIRTANDLLSPGSIQPAASSALFGVRPAKVDDEFIQRGLRQRAGQLSSLEGDLFRRGFGDLLKEAQKQIEGTGKSGFQLAGIPRTRRG